jgi:uncharacterized protein (TIGR00661 family)
LSKKKILITPLSWGIGHATRCIPIIEELISLNFEPVIASDSDALLLLQKEFPLLKTIELPKYNIKYPKFSFLLPAYLFLQVPKLLFAIKKEHQIIKNMIKKENICCIINDNRFGCYSTKVPTVYITHQVNVLSGLLTFFTSKVHQFIINKMDVLWIPDDFKIRFSGKLSNTNRKKVVFIGVLSRFKLPTIKPKIEYDILVLLSGVETQRFLLEKKLIKELSLSKKKVLFVRGVFSDNNQLKDTDNITFVNYLLKVELQSSILKSNLVICRSGYSTIMDLAVLQKKCFFIPTPNQKEQEYLAKRMQNLQIAPFCKQSDFNVKMLKSIKDFKGFNSFENLIDLKKIILTQIMY